jgi:hypothetical protein
MVVIVLLLLIITGIPVSENKIKQSHLKNKTNRVNEL